MEPNKTVLIILLKGNVFHLKIYEMTGFFNGSVSRAIKRFILSYSSII